MLRSLYIFAPQVHQGGGEVLLKSLLKVPISGFVCNVIVDERMSLGEFVAKGWNIKTINSSLRGRLQCEQWLTEVAKSQDVVLFFSSLPPLMKIKGKIYVFLQNKYLIDRHPLIGFPLVTKIKLQIQRYWLRLFYRNSAEFIVQTGSMAAVFRQNVSETFPLSIFPIMECVSNLQKPREASSTRAPRFAYIASGEPHKNHIRLIEAWSLLAKQGLKPELYITVDIAKWPRLNDLLLRKISEHGLLITNYGTLSHDRVLALYHDVDALIYPSTLESFGLPLVEANQARIPILAPELDYVRDLVSPTQTFDPNSEISISRAVKRFLSIGEGQQKIFSPADLLKKISQ